MNTIDETTQRAVDVDAIQIPHSLAWDMVEMAQIKDLDIVMEPSAGKGNLVYAIGKVHAGRTLVCETDPERARELVGSYHREIAFLNDDFLKITSPQMVDKLIMFPPCSSTQSETYHLLQALRMVKPGGRIVALISPRWLKAQGNNFFQDFRDRMERDGKFERRKEWGLDWTLISLNIPHA